MATLLDGPNADIVTCLTKLGIYMRRNEAYLCSLNPTEQRQRLQKIFDRAVENCCIFPLLFSKRELARKKFVMSKKPQWNGWKAEQTSLIRLKAAEILRDDPAASTMTQGQISMRAWVAGMGNHSLWGPFRMGRYSVEASARVQGASVRLQLDVPELETLIMRLLAFVTHIDSLGVAFNGLFWAITGIPAKRNNDNAHLPVPTVADARFVMQPLDVLEIELKEDIDTVHNEDGEPEMAAAGYVGNKNRRAVPVVVVRYATSLHGFGKAEDVQALVRYARIQSSDPTNSYLTAVQLSLLTRILESNSRRLAQTETQKYQMSVPESIRKISSISFISPIYCPSLDLADEFETGQKSRLACAVCKKEQCFDVKLSFCSACAGVAYCSPEHQADDWSSHKADCRSSRKTKVPEAERANSADPASPLTKILLPLHRADSNFSFSERGFVSSSNPIDRLKPASRSSARSNCSKTIYGPDQRFLVRARWGGHAGSMYGVEEDQRRSGKIKAKDPKFQGLAELAMSVIHVVDRPCSFSILLQRRTGSIGRSIVLSADLSGHNQDNSAIFEAIVDVIRRYATDKDKTEAVYLWAKRRGDCIEVFLDDIPDQSLGW